MRAVGDSFDFKTQFCVDHRAGIARGDERLASKEIDVTSYEGDHFVLFMVVGDQGNHGYSVAFICSEIQASNSSMLIVGTSARSGRRRTASFM